MILVKHELRQNRISLLIWTAAIGFFVVVCLLMFPQMQHQTEQVAELFGSLGAFTAAFGMDRLNLGTLIGFYSVECGNILEIGGALFAAMTAVTVLSKEEKDHTAEFLLTHPVRRSRILTEKLIAVLLQILAMNGLVFLISLLSIKAIGETVPLKELSLLHLAYLLMQLELAGICFGFSAFLRRGSTGIGMGFASAMYFLNLIANISEDAACLKYLTPFGYTGAADIVADLSLDVPMVLLGLVCTIAGIAAAYWNYIRKDIR